MFSMISSFSNHSLTKRLVFILFLKSLFILAMIFYAGIELGPDEAQYWTWSQALDWGYYSKPPGIAWQIWLGTQLFGNTEWGVRSLTVLLAFFQSFLIYQLALQAGLLRRTAFWCSLFMAFCPLGMMGSLFAITDVGFLLCWTGACLMVVSALQRKENPDPLKIGGWIMLGSLFKWPIYLFWLFFLICGHWYFSNLKKIRILGGIFISLLGLFPSIWWNWSHDWATFRHVFTTLRGGNGPQLSGNLLSFVGSQMVLISPVLFILLCWGLWHWFQRRKTISPALFFCGFVTLTTLSVITLMSCFQKIQGNWGVFAYPTGLIILGWEAFESSSLRALWAKWGIMLSLLLSVCVFTFPSFYSLPMLASYAPSFQLNPLKHNLGWTRLGQALTRQGYDPDRHFLFSDKYQMTSLLSFYPKGKKRAYFLNLQGERKNQFSYWPHLQEERRKQVGYFVWVENQPCLEHNWKKKLNFYQTELERYFEKVEFVEFVPLIYQGPAVAKAAFFFRCANCKNIKPADYQLY